MADPSSVITEVKSSQQYIWFNPSKDSDEVYTYAIPVDGVEEFVFSLASPFEKNLQLTLVDPNGKEIDLKPLANVGYIPIGDEVQIPTTTYIVPEVERGVYTLSISSDLPKDYLEKLATSGYPNAVVTVMNNDDVVIHTHLSTYEIKEGNTVGIIAMAVEETPSENPINFNIQSAELGVVTPDGLDEMLPMTATYHGLGKFAYAPNDGVYGAEFTATEAGTYLVQATMKGTWSTSTTDAAIPFERTSQYVIQVSSATIKVTGTSAVRTKDAGHFYIDIGVTGTGNQLRAYAEVLGTDPVTSEVKPACWLGGVVTEQDGVVTLVLDVNWLKLAGVTGPLSLQNVYIADLVTSYPVSSSSEQMHVSGSESLHIEPTATPIFVTDEMLFGVNPLPQPNETAPDAISLVALPGYCSSSNPFKPNSADFTNAGFFEMPRGNYNHNPFAQKVLDWLKTIGSDSFSLIGHSQGGCVSTHIANYYFTGLDNAKNGRPITSVGTPYSGCTAAGSLANLGEVFGVGCGSNNDLSLDGSKNWGTGISSATRNKIYLYSTTYEQGGFFGDYCNLPINLVLQWPNDGTTEIKYCKFDGATYLGNTEKQCHTSDMKYPAQYADSARNQQINKLAAR
jgi:hypothetical protein